MSEYDELVKRLRDGDITMKCKDDVVRYTNHVAADAIEALVGEVATLTKDREILTLDLIDRAKEIDALKHDIALHDIALEAKP